MSKEIDVENPYRDSGSTKKRKSKSKHRSKHKSAYKSKHRDVHKDTHKDANRDTNKNKSKRSVQKDKKPDTEVKYDKMKSVRHERHERHDDHRERHHREDSFEKLKSLLKAKKYIINRYFVDNGKYKFLEIISKVNYCALLLDLNHPSLTFNDTKEDEEYTFPINSVEPDKLIDTNYELYKEIKIIDDSDLQLKYKKDIKLEGADNESLALINGIYTQLKRLVYPVKRLKYKLAIMDKDSLCVIDKKNKVKCYYVKKFDSVKKNIIACINIESFYSSENTHGDIKKVYVQLEDILDSNHEDHTVQIQNMLDNRTDIVNKSMHILSVKKKSEDTLNQFYTLLDELRQNEEEFRTEIARLNKEDPVNNSSRISKINMSISKMETVRARTLDSILDERNKLNYLMLTIDSILYNNISMLMKVYENFKILDVIYNKY